MNLANMNTCILSKGYWEQMQLDQSDGGAAGATNDFAPPAFLKKAFDDFAGKYQQFKRMRTVNFRANLGSV